MRRCAKLRSTLFSRRGSCSSSRKYPVILFICSQLQRFLPNKMFRTKGILLVTTFLCFPGVISATCPRSSYKDLNDTLQSPRKSQIRGTTTLSSILFCCASSAINQWNVKCRTQNEALFLGGKRPFHLNWNDKPEILAKWKAPLVTVWESTLRTRVAPMMFVFLLEKE